MKILVTGGCGFIGSDFIRYILEKYPSYKVINIDKLTYAGNVNNLKNISNNKMYNFVHGDICNSELVKSLVRGVDIIVHFAAESHVDNSIFDCKEFIKTNVLGTQVLIDIARKCGNIRFHHVSTDEVFGELGITGKFNENTSYAPRNPYSASKAAADHLVRSYFHTYGLPITISNCSNNYGPFHHPEKLIPRAIIELLSGENIPLHGDGKDVKDWIYVRDHIRAIDLIITKGKIGETYCIGGNCEMSNIEVSKEILKEMELPGDRIKFVRKRPGHDRRYAIDFSKITSELGWSPKCSFKDGLKQTIRWYKENKSWWEPLRESIYSEGKLVFD